MLRLAVQMARYRVAALLAVACAALGGAVLVTVIGVLTESGFRSHAPVGRLAAADVVVSASQTHRPPGALPIALPERARVPAALAERLDGLDGVAAAVADVSFPAAVTGRGGNVVPPADPASGGHGWSSVRLLAGARVTGEAPAGAREVALDRATAAAAGVERGDELEVFVAGSPEVRRVSAVVDSPERGVYVSDAEALRLAGPAGGSAPATADLIAVRAEDSPGAADRATAAVRDELRDGTGDSGLTVSTGPARGDAESPGAAAARTLLPALAGSLAGVTLLVVGFIIAGALSVTIGAQRAELALMRAVGATPRQVRRLTAAQATAVTLVVAVPGIALGYVLAERFRELLVRSGMLPDALPLTVGPLPALAALLLLVGVVQVSARCAAWRVSRRPATEAVAESRSEPRTPSRRRTSAGLLLLLAAHVIAVTPLLIRSELGASTTSLAGIIAAIGLALAGPDLVVRAAGALARRLPANASAPAWLAVANSRGYALRVAGAVTTLALVVVFTLTYTLTQTTVLTAKDRDVHDGTRAQFGLTAPAVGGLTDARLAEVRETPGVRAAAPVTRTTALWPYRFGGDTETESASALVLTPAAGGVLDLGVRDGDLADLAGATVAVDSRLAGSRDAGVGEEVRLILGDGAEVTATVVATYDRGLGFGPVVLSRDLAAGHTTTGMHQSIWVRTDGTAAARQDLAAFAAARPGLAVSGSPGIAAPDEDTAVPPELWINVAVLAVLLGYLLLGIANKLVATTAQRRNELAVLRLIGATPAQVKAMMRREAGLVYAMALTAGVAVSAVPLALLGTGFLGRPWPAGPLWLLPAVAAGAAGIAFLTIEVPTRRMLHTPAVRAFGRP